MTARSTFLGPVVAAMVAVACAFTGVIVISQFYARDISKAVTAITSNSAPSVHYLGEARSQLWDLQVKLMEAEDDLTEGRPVELGDVSALLARVDHDWQLYSATPDFLGEEERRLAVEPQLTNLRQYVLSTVHALEDGDLATARTLLRSDVKTSFKKVGLAMLALIRLNNDQGRFAALRADELRRTSLLIAITMGTLALVLTALLGWAVASGMNKIQVLRDAHDRLQETRTAELEAFAARVSHDLRGPLSTALLGCDIAERGDGWQVDRIRRGLRRMTALVNDLYNFARAASDAPTHGPTPLRTAVESALEEFTLQAHEAAVSMTAEALPDCEISAAPGIVHSVLANLLGNALKHAGRGAHVRVRARVDARLRVEVEDDGPGIPSDMEARVFDPYIRGAQAPESGIGLGLATVKRLVERHGGSCGVRSAQQHGAIFWFELPVKNFQGTNA